MSQLLCVVTARKRYRATRGLEQVFRYAAAAPRAALTLCHKRVRSQRCELPHPKTVEPPIGGSPPNRESPAITGDPTPPASLEGGGPASAQCPNDNFRPSRTQAELMRRTAGP